MVSLAAPLRLIVDAALPPRCAACGAITRDAPALCGDCFGKLRMIGPPWCAGCCLPFEHDMGEGAMCGACMERPPRHAGVRAAVAYGDVAAELAIKLKHGGRVGIAPLLGRLMARHVDGEAPLLVPVPLHRWRIWHRGFNQAALIGREIARATKGTLVVDALARRMHTPSLGGLGAKARAKTLRGVIVPGPGAAAVKGREVWLIDDVYTSGATANACVSALHKAGASEVTIVTWARVLRDAPE